MFCSVCRFQGSSFVTPETQPNTTQHWKARTNKKKINKIKKLIAKTIYFLFFSIKNKEIIIICSSVISDHTFCWTQHQTCFEKKCWMQHQTGQTTLRHEQLLNVNVPKTLVSVGSQKDAAAVAPAAAAPVVASSRSTRA